MKVTKTINGITKSLEIDDQKAFLLGEYLLDLDFMDVTGSNYAFRPITLDNLRMSLERAELELNKMLDHEFNVKK